MSQTCPVDLLYRLMEREEKHDKDGAKMIASAIIGMDYKLIVVNDKAYLIHPPTIARIAGASYWLCDFNDGGNTLREILASLSKSENLAKALSWFINGDDSIAEELAKGTMKEVVDGLEAAFSMVDAENFIRLSALLRSVRMLIAKQK